MAREVGDLLAGLSVVERNYPRVTCGSEILVRRGEFDCPDRFYQPAEGVREALGAVVEEVEGAVLVAGGCEATVGGDVDAEGEGAFGFVAGEGWCW